MDRSNWCYVSGVVSAREGKLFPAEFFRSLLACESVEHVFLAVSDTPLKEVFPRASALSEADSLLRERAHREYQELRKLSPDPAVVDLFLFRDEFYNVKVHLKAKLAGMELEPVPNGEVTPEMVERLWAGLPTLLDAVFVEPIAALHLHVDPDAADASTRIDWVLDTAYFHWAMKRARGLRAPAISRYIESLGVLKTVEVICRAQADGVDMKQFARIALTGELDRPELHAFCGAEESAKRALLLRYLPQEAVDAVLSGDEQGMLSRLQVQTANFLLDAASDLKGVTFGPERVFGYLCGLQRQTHNLRLCLAGKANGIHSDLLAMRLLESYA